MSFWQSSAVLAGCICAGIATGCSPNTVDAPFVNSSSAASAAVKQYDADGDGELSAEELAKAPGIQAAVKTADLNSDGGLSQSELQSRISKLVGDEVGFMSCNVIVRLDGRPLPDAEVKLIPEECLGATFKQAEGTTAPEGTAALRMSGENLPGVQCGWFQVQISKKNSAGEESLPAVYNTQTTLGVEIALDNPALERGVAFDLKSQP